ncbi:potassium channel subfamily T member 1-like isoform X2 [Argopecten irradians]|uniref:potassium channel subfamily T member 1-like isoform X2 n=1 Tax=Argopecten irradians TaxID=31199 RepID=UPI00370FF204
MRIILEDPKWAHRVVYIRGSALNDTDLERCRLWEADACFFLSQTTCGNRQQTDQLILMQYLAVKDFARHCQLYVQIYKEENKIHVYNEDSVICGEEMKFAILANNCLHPGLSTLIILLVNSTTAEAVTTGMDPLLQLYSRQSRHSLYNIQLNQSHVFRQYRGWSFTLASADAHKRYGVCLLAVQDTTTSRIILNPGPDYKLRDHHTLFYISDVPDKYMAAGLISYREGASLDYTADDNNNIPLEKTEVRVREIRRRELGSLDPGNTGARIVSSPWEDQGYDHQSEPGDGGLSGVIMGTPPRSSRDDPSPIQCHVTRLRRSQCCLTWNQACDHFPGKNTRHERIGHQMIILAVDEEGAGITNFIIPLRSYNIESSQLRPIVVLLRKRPGYVFLETIAHFPDVFWMEGSITSVDDLTKAGINEATHLIVASQPSDSDTVFAVRTIQNRFPHVHVVFELTQASNLRFTYSNVPDGKDLAMSKLERMLKEKMSSTLPHLFRQDFAAGNVFSISMLDTLLYQTFVRPSMLTLIRLLVGIEANNNDGYLSSISVDGMGYTTYGELYNGLASISGSIPIGLYKTRIAEKDDLTEHLHEFRSSSKMTGHIKSRHKISDIDTDTCTTGWNRNGCSSFVILNPTPDIKLTTGDIAYVVRPGNSIDHLHTSTDTTATRDQNKWAHV